MDLIFNELSTQPIAHTREGAYERVDCFIATFKRAQSLGFNKIRFENSISEIYMSPDFTLHDFCSTNRLKGQLLLGLARYPFIDSETSEENRFLESNFYLLRNGHRIPAYGLAAAWLYGSMGIGFLSEAFWDAFLYQILITGSEEQATHVLCASKPNHFESKEFDDWINNHLLNKLIQGQGFIDLFPEYDFSTRARKDLNFWENDKSKKYRLFRLLRDIKMYPFMGGLGKTESLKGYKDTYSKRIDDANRLVYIFTSDNKVEILACHGHYEDF